MNRSWDVRINVGNDMTSTVVMEEEEERKTELTL
jgi:hypothetical protein